MFRPLILVRAIPSFSPGVSSFSADTSNTCQVQIHEGLLMKEMPLPWLEIALGDRRRVVWPESEANQGLLHLPIVGHTSLKTLDPVHP